MLACHKEAVLYITTYVFLEDYALICSIEMLRAGHTYVPFAMYL